MLCHRMSCELVCTDCGSRQTQLIGGTILPRKHERSSRDTRAVWVKGYEISSQVITIALELVLPGLLGFFADRWLHIFPILTSLGMVFGFAAGTVHFIHFAQTLNRLQGRKGSDRRDTPPDAE